MSMSRGFLLHSRPYRESSVIATFITDTDGRLDLVVRSARGKQGKKNRPVLPFCLYELSWVGKHDLKLLQFFEPAEAIAELSGSALFCGFYLNELLYYLLPRSGPEQVLLQAYSMSLQQLSSGNPMEPPLRIFEMVLLDNMGYGIDFFSDHVGVALDPDGWYRFVPENGLVRVVSSESQDVGKGENYLAIGNRDFSSPEVCRLAKITLRKALSVYLGGRRLRSREFFL